MKAAFDRRNSPYVHIFVRTDLPPADQTVQACHAALLLPPLSGHERLVILGVPDQRGLLDQRDRLLEKGLRPFVFEEPDHDLGATALAVQSGLGGRIGAGRFRLWTPPIPASLVS